MAKSVLLSKIRTEIRRKNLSYHIEQIYIGWITRFIYFHNLQHPKKLREADVVEFLNYLVLKREVSVRIQDEANSALHFLYQKVLGKPLDKLEGLIEGKTPNFKRSFTNYRRQQIKAS